MHPAQICPYYCYRLNQFDQTKSIIMKKVLTLFAAIGFFSLAALAQNGAAIEAEASTHNFGEVPQGIPVKHDFTVTNNGTDPLVIDNVKTTCGCTVTKWPKEPIMPGESATITAQYNAAKVGHFKKPATVISNASNGQVQLFLEGTVVSKTDKADDQKSEN